MKDFRKYLDELKFQAQYNPLATAAVGAGLIVAIAKLMDANTKRRTAKTWELEVERRRMNIR